MGRVIPAILIGVALFGFLRAGAVVGERWGIRSRRSTLGIVATAIAVALLLYAWRSVLAVLVAAALLGVALYAGWRVRRV
ncbi:MAG TPA: hypothetical protein VID69_08140 [Actinomycetota bacterium]